MEEIAWILLAGSASSAAVWAWVTLGSGAGAVLEHPLDEPPGKEGPEPVTVVVPGRDEAEHLPFTLRELLEQDTRRPFRVVFVDDASSDATPAVIADLQKEHPHRLLAVRNDLEPPPGWTGKCRAIQRGLGEAGFLEPGPEEEAAPRSPGAGEPAPQAADPLEHPGWLLFTDADIHFGPDLVRAAVNHAEARGADVLGLVPQLRFGSVGESVVQLQLVIALSIMLPRKHIVNPERPEALTGGAFILVRHELYAAAGGHAAVRGEVVEDLQLGRALKAAGGRMEAAVAGDRLWCRMYDGWLDQWEGLTKNAYAGLNHRPVLALGLATATAVCNVGPALFLPLAAGLGLAGGTAAVAAWTAAGLAGTALALQARTANAARKICGLPPLYALAVPAGSAIYLAILATSAFQHHRGGNVWKGRRYAAG